MVSLACQTSFRTGCYRLEIISARAEKRLHQFTVPTGTGTFEVLTSSKVKQVDVVPSKNQVFCC